MISQIVTRKSLSEQLVKLEIRIPEHWDKPQPGQYLILRILSDEEGVMLPVVKVDSNRETLTVIASSLPEQYAVLLNPCAFGNQVDLEGPFGQAFRIEKYDSVLCVADQKNIIPIYPVISALRASGSHVTTLLTYPASNESVIENEIRNISDDFIIGNQSIRQTIERLMITRKMNQVFVIGSAQTIRETYSAFRANNSLVQAMLFLNEQNQRGLHGIFRVSICGSSRSICVDGHNFNAYYSDFDELVRRFENSITSITKMSKEKLSLLA